MTDRIQSLTVVLDRDMRADDTESLIAAILHLKGVASVGNNVVSVGDFVAQARAKRELQTKIAAVLWPEIEEQKP